MDAALQQSVAISSNMALPKPECLDEDASVVEQYIFTPGKLSSLGNYFTKNENVALSDEHIFNAIEADDTAKLRKELDKRGTADIIFVVDTLLKSRWSALQQACQKGHYECVKILIEYGASMESQDDMGKTAINYCVVCEWTEIMQLLIDAGCNLETRDHKFMTPLHQAVHCTTTDPLTILLNSGSQVDARDIRNRTPLMLAACTDGKYDFIEALIKHGAFIDAMDGPEQCTALQMALMHAKEDQQPYLDLLLSHGASVQAQSQMAASPVQNIILRGRAAGNKVDKEELELIKMFILRGCDINHVTNNKSWHFMRGTALKMAADRGNLEIVQLLLEHGAQPDLTDDTGVTPLLIATKKGFKDVVKELLLNNASLELKGLLKLENGTEIRRLNPFHCSLLKGYWDITRMIVAAGHDLSNETYLWTNEDLPELLIAHDEFWLWLQGIISQPQSLMEIIKRYMRNHMGYRIKSKLQNVPLPIPLKNYLLQFEFDT